MEANSESRAFEQERMQHSDVEASVQDTVEPVRKMSQMRQLAAAIAGVERARDVRYGSRPLVGKVTACGIQPPACVE